MKKRHYLFFALFTYLLSLIITVPASLVTGLITDERVNIQGVSGTLWNGKAYTITINNAIQLNNTQWSVNAWKLLTGKIAIATETTYQDNNISAELGSSFLGRYFINNLQASLPARDIAQLADIPLAQLAGLMTFNITHAQWKQGELPQATGEITWKNATVTVTDTASLGNINIVLGESKQQLLNADIKNQGGDMSISGNAELVPEANYMLNIRLSPTATASDSIIQSLGMFAKRQANGDYLINSSGALNQTGLI